MRREEFPDSVVLAELALNSGYEKLTLDAGSRTGKLAVDGMRLDLGGIGKGYAADAALAVLKAEGLVSALVAASGDIAAGAPPPGREAWRVGVASIDAEDGRAGRVVLLRDAAVSTSGDNWQFVEIGGRRYSHIVDPRTGIGLGERIGVTVVGPNATATDSYATAVSVLGAERGMALIAGATGVEAAIVEIHGDGVVRRESPGFSALLDSEERKDLDFRTWEEGAPREESASAESEAE
jgi:thiamine biosynthesis lipoprotein